MLRKNIMSDMAFLSSCRATNGQMIQLMVTAAITPTTKAAPLLTAIKGGDTFSLFVMRARDVTVKDTQPTRPDR